MLIRHAGERWHSPASESFDDDATVELLLKESLLETSPYLDRGV